MSVFVWLDLETTGIDENICQIIEAAAIITNEKFEPLEDYEAIINPGAVSYEEGALKLHKKSGLYDRVRDGKPLAEVEEDLLSLIMRYEPYKYRAKLSGNSVHFDRRFMRRYMPSIISHISRRNFDVSSIGILMHAVYGADKAEYRAPRPHRALADLHRSISELRHYTSNFLKEIN